MKILVIGLESAAPEILFNDERLTNFRMLMEGGCYGRLESVVPTAPVPSWMCMATSQDPGSLGVYGLRNRADYTYDDLALVNSQAIEGLTIWDQVARAGKRANIIGVPACSAPSVMQEIAGITGDYPLDVKDFQTASQDRLKEEVYSMSRKHFDIVRHYLQHCEWDYFQFVEIGLNRLQQGFWKEHEEETIRDYYLYLDEELGKIFEVLDEDTAILVMSCYEAQKLKSGFCINEWLVKEGLLVLNQYPIEITPLSKLDVNWQKTRVWSAEGDGAGVFFNVKGREPYGVIDEFDYERFRDEIKAKLAAAVDDNGKPMGMLVYKPSEIYKTVRQVAPDLLVDFGGLSERSGEEVGHTDLYARENHTGSDASHPGRFGSFILAASNNPLSGVIEGAHILDISPTLLELGGYDIPSTMQGKSLVKGKTLESGDTGFSADDEELLRQRLSGLGYIS